MRLCYGLVKEEFRLRNQKVDDGIGAMNTRFELEFGFWIQKDEIALRSLLVLHLKLVSSIGIGVLDINHSIHQFSYSLFSSVAAKQKDEKAKFNEKPGEKNEPSRKD